MNEDTEPLRIVQLIKFDGSELLGLGSDGIVYHLPGKWNNGWESLIPPLTPKRSSGDTAGQSAVQPVREES